MTSDVVMAISAVRTTGIYCRAGCVARPLQKNVTMYQATVTAEAAGFRACLRCRPDRQPSWVPPETMPDPLRRAVALISDGALDDGTEQALAASVGFSARHLRRLFLEHIGASPSFVARSRRAHFARSLLDDTVLSITDIAFASGFTSVRQMNRVVMEVFRFTPTDLRRRSRTALPNAADGGLELRLPLAVPSSSVEVFDFLEPRCTPGVESVEHGTYRRTLELCGHVGAIEISSAGNDVLAVTAHLPTYAGLVDVVGRVNRLFGSDMDHLAALEHLCSDELLGDVVELNQGLRVPGAWDPFESLVRIVVGQQITVLGASTLTGRVAGVAGRPVEGLRRLGLDRLFPSADELLESDLADLGLTDRRVSTLRCLAESVTTGDVDVFAPADLLRQSLVSLPGIGPWTAELAATRVSRDPDAFAPSDLGIRRGVSRLVGSEMMSAEQVEQLAERWRPHRALAAAHLWRL